jgi:DNA repair exonuclease SbcCD ATPase subunit
MNKAFLQYRLRYGRSDNLSSNYRPKTKESFMEGTDLVKDLQEFLKLHNFPFIYSLQSSAEKVEDIDGLIQDDKLNLRGVDEQIAELEEQRNQVLNRIENLEKLKEKISLTC